MRIKWEPLALMALMLALGLWLVAGPRFRSEIAPREGARTHELRVGNSRGLVETVRDPATGEFSFRLLFRDGAASPALDAARFREQFGEGVYADCTREGGSMLFRVLNITTWSSLAWIAVGFGGQLMFSGRALLQWILSERRRRSVVPPMFWWLSLFGGVCLFAYFVWRQDAVGVLGQSSGIVIYARNLRLLHKERRRGDTAAGGEDR